MKKSLIIGTVILWLGIVVTLPFAPAAAAEETGTVPRVSYMRAPVFTAVEGGAGYVPAAFTGGASLVFTREGIVCVSPLNGEEMILYHIAEEFWEGLPDVVEVETGGPVSNFLYTGDKVLFMSGGREMYGDDFTETVLCSLLSDEDEEEWYQIIFEPGEPGEPRLSADDPPGAGTFMRTAGGELYYSAPDGALFVMDKNGSFHAAGAKIAASDMVYYNGYIYFANLNDTKVYPGITYPYVFSDEMSDPEDLLYPRLYRVKPDGTALEKLTDSGIRGLTARGPYILYQHIDEGFITAWPEAAPGRAMYGPLYCLNAETGETAPLYIESDMYFATPYGIAVWYHDFDVEPYEVTAELILHDFNGRPLRKLDADGRQSFGPFGVTDDAVVFCGIEDWRTLEWVFVTVPLNGGPAYAEQPYAP